MVEWQPIRFEPQLIEKIWGGNRLSTELGKPGSGNKRVGESWELSTVPGHISKVAEGPHKGILLSTLLEKFGDEILGPELAPRYGSTFPLLIKFLDAMQDLSIQVHPDDAMAHRKHKCPGKTEMWYIMDAKPPGKLICGFKENASAEQFSAALKAGTLLELLNEEQVEKGDVYYIPAGRIHTIGAGLLIAEIQQSSDITYRIWDFDRTDAHGNKRDLHIREAEEALDYTAYSRYSSAYDKEMAGRQRVVESPYFHTYVNYLAKEFKKVSLGETQCARVITVVEGEGRLHFGKQGVQEIKKGEVWLLPAAMGKSTLATATDLRVLETEVVA
jgi:mannose-6-phosphate isomerase